MTLNQSPTDHTLRRPTRSSYLAPAANQPLKAIDLAVATKAWHLIIQTSSRLELYDYHKVSVTKMKSPVLPNVGSQECRVSFYLSSTAELSDICRV